ncbi:hypothetical protein BC829DRAFT_91977 [Chytridium lagenaria]|nr:hypothetical protein BC829DRAFT_91977 [Chytridium lagenaria]
MHNVRLTKFLRLLQNSRPSHTCISSCKLTGAIPNAFSALKNLDTLDLSGNELTGSIPLSLLSLPKLERLYLTNNKLGGTLPAVGDLAPLNLFKNGSAFDIFGNLLYGTISTDYASLPIQSILTDQNCIRFEGPAADFVNTEKFSGTCSSTATPSPSAAVHQSRILLIQATLLSLILLKLSTPSYFLKHESPSFPALQNPSQFQLFRKPLPQTRVLTHNPDSPPSLHLRIRLKHPTELEGFPGTTVVASVASVLFVLLVIFYCFPN